MAMDPLLPIFDGHNDVISKLLDAERTQARTAASVGENHHVRGFFERSDEGHIDLARAKDAGFAGGLFSIYVAADTQAEPPAGAVLGLYEGFPIRFPRQLELGYAQRTSLAQLGVLFRLQREGDGQVRVVRTLDELKASMADGALAAIVHFEGAEAIDPRLDALEVFHAAGLRSVGPVWSRPE
jgi:membrane dipeptidase